MLARGQPCRQCGAPLEVEDRFCWSCGAPRQGVGMSLEDQQDFPVERGVRITDWISLGLLTAGAFVVGSVAAVVWENRTNRPLPEPLGKSPVTAGALAASVVLLLGCAYLIVLVVLSRRNRR
jgi:hypothetical protein